MLSSQRFISTATLLVVSLLIMLSMVGLSGCSSQIAKKIKTWNPDDYTVKSGDTLYSIAWRYEIDPEKISAWNNIALSKRLKAGQRLHTRKPANFNAAAYEAKQKKTETARVSGIVEAEPDSKPVYLPAPKRSTGGGQKSNTDANWIEARAGDSLYLISKRSNVSIARLAQLNQLKKPYVIQPGQTIYIKPLPASPSVKSRNTNAKNTSNSKKAPTIKASAMSWPRSVRWVSPAKGKVIKKFSRKSNGPKGIDIAGKMGNSVFAAADGKVVYSGNGLISYGNLIIIKHNKTYLSAYAYNRKLLVKEGTSVKAGQKIAEMGRKDKLSPRLHFEIRKNGKSVDPLKYLR